MKRGSILLVMLLCALACGAAQGAGGSRHLVIVVWDGMRPDFVTETNTPTLYQLAHTGVTFQNHHPAYLSTTEVNGSALSTGGYPVHDGLVGNVEFRPAIDPRNPFHTESLESVRKGDELTHGNYLKLPTLIEIARRAGRKTAVAGAKGIALLLDRSSRTDASSGAVVFAGQSLPPDLADTLTNRYGPFPAAGLAKPTRNDWTTLALVDSLWEDGVPDISVLWMSEPDATQHKTGPGSADSLAAIRNADDNLDRVLRALDLKGARDSTDVFVVSDHGFSTILSVVDPVDSMHGAGINALREFPPTPGVGDVLVVSDGGSSLIYAANHDAATIQKVVDFLQHWSHTGVILTKQAMPGTFPIAQVEADSPDAPDVIVSYRWTADKNDSGTPGMLEVDAPEYQAGQGMHGSLSRFDMHNTLIAAGPDFRSGIVDVLPSGNVDITPTALWILGLKAPKPMDGRVLSEALSIKAPKLKSYEPQHLEAVREMDKTVWRQYLNYSEVNGTLYFDEGNGAQTTR